MLKIKKKNNEILMFPYSRIYAVFIKGEQFSVYTKPDISYRYSFKDIKSIFYGGDFNGELDSMVHELKKKLQEEEE